MSILTKAGILLQKDTYKNIVIEPFHEKALGPNSYDLHLGLGMKGLRDGIIDPLRNMSSFYGNIEVSTCDKTGKLYYQLHPGHLYLGVTHEYTETRGFVPVMEGKSSLGRMGIECHVCAGMGDDGFCGYWTLEIRVMNPTRLYIGQAIGQVVYHTMEGEANTDNYKITGSYNNAKREPGIPNFHTKIEKSFIEV